MRRIGEHAVVIGASMAGLLAARSLTEAYERVTVLDRDSLPPGPAGRRAVPQGRHPHALLPHGQACLDALLPGFSGELVAAGASSCAALEEMRFVLGGHQLARASMGTSAVLAGRPFIEGHVRRRVRELPEVTLVDGCDALGLTTSRDGKRVTGVRILRRADGSAEETLASDLVVAATGRAGRVPAWLEALLLGARVAQRLGHLGRRDGRGECRVPVGVGRWAVRRAVTAEREDPAAVLLGEQEHRARALRRRPDQHHPVAAQGAGGQPQVAAGVGDVDVQPLLGRPR